jgi:putative ABC transport system substrate-binding protein
MTAKMKRREFITLFGGAAAWPLAARAQQPERMRRVGVLTPYTQSDPEGQLRIIALREGLQKLGWTEDRNIRIEYRWATSDLESTRKLAKELIDLQPDLSLTDTTVLTAATLESRRAQSWSSSCRSTIRSAAASS